MPYTGPSKANAVALGGFFCPKENIMNEVSDALSELKESDTEVVVNNEPYIERASKSDRITRSYFARVARRGVKRIRRLRKKKDPRRGYNSLKNWRDRNGN